MVGGGYTGNTTVQGTWSPAFRTCHINFLELMAAYLVLRKVQPARGTHIRLVLDNTTAVACISRGGSRSAVLNKMTLTLLRLQNSRSWTLTASHLAGVRNVVADALSRGSIQQTEWSLDLQSFHFVTTKVPSLEIDLFATRENHKLRTYCSPDLDPGATATDALSVEWNRWEYIYLFPPISIIQKVLVKLRSFQGLAALIAPHWVNSPWFPLLMELGPTMVHLPNPRLHQTVQGVTYYESSLLTHNLRLWIFKS